MASTFARVTSVVVDPNFCQTDVGRYPDASLQSGGANASSVVPLQGLTATAGQLWRGMPIGLLQSSAKLVPMSASGAVYQGVLTDDLTAFVLATGRKITFVKKGTVRSYAAGSLNVGDPVKADVAANFSGFLKWVDGTDDQFLLRGYARPLDDGSASNGSTAASTMAQGDTIFVDLI